MALPGASGPAYLTSDPSEGSAFLRDALTIYLRIGSPNAERVQAALREL